MPTLARRAPRRLLALVVAPVAAAAAVAGCASSPGAGDTDPAGLVPAGAPVYVEAVVRPDGAEAADSRAALAKILRTGDPGGKLVQLFDRRSRDRGVRFAQDVEPWLGNRVGVGVVSLGGGRPDHVVVAASTDDDKARQAIDKIQGGGDERTYRDVDYTFDPQDGTAAAVVGDAVVIGTEPGLKGAVDAAKGDSLADEDALRKARESVAQERSGFAYLDVARFLRQAVGAAGNAGAQAAPFVDTIAASLPKTIGAALDAEPDLLRIDSVALGGPDRPAARSGADALAALPADSWLALGAGDVGQTLTDFLDGIASGGGLAGIGVEALLNQAQQTTGLDIRKDVLAWMGDAGLFVAGTTPGGARAALVVASKDPAATRSTVQKLRTLLGRSRDLRPLNAAGVDEGFVIPGDRGADRGIYVAAAGDRFVVANGEAAVRDALSPGARLGSEPALQDAAAKLGTDVRPSFFLDVEQLVALADSKHGSDRHFERLRPYLEAFGVVAGGSKRDGDVTRGRAIATLK